MVCWILSQEMKSDFIIMTDWSIMLYTSIWAENERPLNEDFLSDIRNIMIRWLLENKQKQKTEKPVNLVSIDSGSFENLSEQFFFKINNSVSGAPGCTSFLCYKYLLLKFVKYVQMSVLWCQILRKSTHTHHVIVVWREMKSFEVLELIFFWSCISEFD